MSSTETPSRQSPLPFPSVFAGVLVLGKTVVLLGKLMV